jgi:hypothetical protein
MPLKFTRYREQKSALKTARDVLLFRHEMGGGYVPQDVLTAVHQIDTALGNKLTALQCVGDK